MPPWSWAPASPELQLIILGLLGVWAGSRLLAALGPLPPILPLVARTAILGYIVTRITHVGAAAAAGAGEASGTLALLGAVAQLLTSSSGNDWP